MSNGSVLKGIITKSIAGFCYVEVGNAVYECKPRGAFRKSGISPLAGDRVEITVDENKKGTVEKIFDRKNMLIRPPLSNIDKLFIVSSACLPSVNTLLIDRMIAIAEYLDIEPIIVFNKADIGDFQNIPEIYEKIGYKTFIVSGKNNEGLEKIKQELSGVVSAFSGNSGVGKSTILNAILPELSLNVGEVSEKLGRGRHTTRHVELYKAFNGYVADTPGFSSLELTDFSIEDKTNLQYCFKEFAEYIGSCRFSSCAHISEPGCPIVEAVNNGSIAKSRHENYITLYDDLKKINSWEINKK